MEITKYYWYISGHKTKNYIILDFILKLQIYKISNKKLLNKRQLSAVVICTICTTNLISFVFNNIPIIKKPLNQIL